MKLVWHIQMGFRGCVFSSSKHEYSQKVFDTQFARIAVIGNPAIHRRPRFHRDTESHRKLLKALAKAHPVPIAEWTKEDMFHARIKVLTGNPLLQRIIKEYTILPRLPLEEAFHNRESFVTPLSRLFNDKARWGFWEDWEEWTLGMFWMAFGKWQNVDFYVSFKLRRALDAVRKKVAELDLIGFFDGRYADERDSDTEHGDH